MTEEKRIFDEITEIVNDRYEITLESLKERGLCLDSKNSEEFIRDLNKTDMGTKVKVITYIIDGSFKYYKGGMFNINVSNTLKRFPEILQIIKNQSLYGKD